MENSKPQLPPAGGDKVFLVATSVWEKIRRLLDRPQVAMDPTQFSYTEDGTGVRTYRFGGAAGTGIFDHPFRLTVSNGTAGAKYKIAPGSITQGTNGDAIALSGLFDVERSASAGIVVIEADVDGSLELSDWGVSIISVGSAEEVGFSGGDPETQNKLRLVIGKITLDEGTATATQALYTSVRTGYAVLNGVEVVVFEAAPTHPSTV